MSIPPLPSIYRHDRYEDIVHQYWEGVSKLEGVWCVVRLVESESESRFKNVEHIVALKPSRLSYIGTHILM
jgi:hypothetical protein